MDFSLHVAAELTWIHVRIIAVPSTQQSTPNNYLTIDGSNDWTWTVDTGDKMLLKHYVEKIPRNNDFHEFHESFISNLLVVAKQFSFISTFLERNPSRWILVEFLTC